MPSHTVGIRPCSFLGRCYQQGARAHTHTRAHNDGLPRYLCTVVAAASRAARLYSGKDDLSTMTQFMFLIMGALVFCKHLLPPHTLTVTLTCRTKRAGCSASRLHSASPRLFLYHLQL